MCDNSNKNSRTLFLFHNIEPRRIIPHYNINHIQWMTTSLLNNTWHKIQMMYCRGLDYQGNPCRHVGLKAFLTWLLIGGCTDIELETRFENCRRFFFDGLFISTRIKYEDQRIVSAVIDIDFVFIYFDLLISGEHRYKTITNIEL